MDFLSLLLVSFIVGCTDAAWERIYLRKETQGSENHVNIHCSSTDIIALYKITPPTYRCTHSYEYCVSNVENSLKNCSEKTTCKISTNVLSGCPALPLYVSINYKCRRRWNFLTTDNTVSMCTNYMSPIFCRIGGKIEIQRVTILDTVKVTSEEAINSLGPLCNNKKRCESDGSSNLSCGAFVEISYYCKDNSTTFIPTFPSTTTMSTTTKDDNVADSDVQIKIDEEDVVRVSLKNDLGTLCADNWDDIDAGVVCKSLRNQSGKALKLNSIANDKILPFILNCNGNEASLLDCQDIVQNCSSRVVAGVQCCEELPCSQKTSLLKNKDQNSENSVIGMSVGIPLTVIGIAVTTFVLIYMKRRNTDPKDKKGNQPRRHIANQNEDYTGQQGFALPNTSRGATNNHNARYTPASQSESGGSRNKNSLNNRIQLYSLTSNPNEYGDSTYAASQDGVYDHAHDRRHAESEANTYGHSVDGVYDFSNQQQRYDVEGDSSYCRVVDTVYDSSDHGGVPKDSVDNTYSRTVDTSYDTAGQIKGQHSQDNIYD